MRSVISPAAFVLALLLAAPPRAAGAADHGDPMHRELPARVPDTLATSIRDGAAVAPSPDSLVGAALERAPSLAVLRARVQEAREMVRPAGALANPMVEVMLQDVGFPKWTVGNEDMSMLGPQISQAFPFPGKRGARRHVAQAEVAVKQSELEQLRREVARDMRTYYARLYAVDREQRALASGHELLGVLAATVRDRYSAGVAEGEAAIKAQLVLSRVGEQLDDLTAERKVLVGAMNRLLDLPGDAPIGLVARLPDPDVPAMPWEATVLQGSVEIATRRAEVAAAERKLNSARLERWPDLVAGAGLGYRRGKETVTTLRLGLDLPIWSTQNQGPMIRAAAQNLEASRQSLRETEATARAEAARLEANWTRAGLQTSRYAQTIVPQSDLALDAARSSYLVGRGNFSTVIEDFYMWLEARKGLAEREAERYTTWAELQAAIAPSGAAENGRKGR
jgi:cobalt-zinc-cadmium efflux system outer membrane protein